MSKAIHELEKLMDQYPHREQDTFVTHGFPASFGFKGGRDYVPGSDIYPAAIEVARELWGRYPDEAMVTFHKLLKHQGIFRLRSGVKGTASEDIYARFVFRLAEKKYELVLNALDQPIRATRPYDEKDVLRFSKMHTNSIRMTVRSDYNYMEQIIAMTKRLHEVVYPNVRAKWLFTRLHIKDRIDPKGYRECVLVIKAERKLQNILSQCSIFLNELAVGHIFFTAIANGV